MLRLCIVYRWLSVRCVHTGSVERFGQRRKSSWLISDLVITFKVILTNTWVHSGYLYRYTWTRAVASDSIRNRKDIENLCIRFSLLARRSLSCHVVLARQSSNRIFVFDNYGDLECPDFGQVSCSIRSSKFFSENHSLFNRFRINIHANKGSSFFHFRSFVKFALFSLTRGPIKWVFPTRSEIGV